MHKFALTALLALSLVGLSGCGTKTESTRTASPSTPSSTTATASAESTPQVGPGSAAWTQQVTAYFAQWNAVDDKELAAGQVLVDFIKILDSGDEPSKAQISKLVRASKDYPQLITEAQAIIPPAELKAYHTLWLQTLTANSNAMKAMSDGMIDLDLAKLKKAEKQADAADAAQKAQDAELKRFNTEFGTDYK